MTAPRRNAARPFLRAAHACRIDGLIKMECERLTVQQISERLRIDRKVVFSVLSERGWFGRVTKHPSETNFQSYLAAVGEPVELAF